MKIKKIISIIAGAAVCISAAAVSAFADVTEPAAWLENPEYYEYYIYGTGSFDNNGKLIEVNFREGYLDGQTREEVKEKLKEAFGDGELYVFADYEDPASFSIEDFGKKELARSQEEDFDTEDDIPKYYPLEGDDDTLVEDEAEAIYDEPQKGEGYYICHISFHDGVPEIHDENGDIYAIWDEEGGYMQEGEAREDIENAVAESMREQLASIGANPDDYGFDVYLYFYDDYDFTSEEFFDFVNEDILRRDSERAKPTANVPNPVTGAGLPCPAAVLAVLSAVGIFAVNKKKL